MVVPLKSSWKKSVIVDKQIADKLGVCVVCGDILELGSSISICYEKPGSPSFGVHRGSGYGANGSCCESIFIGAYVSNYLYAQGKDRGDMGIAVAYSELSAIFSLGRRHLQRLYEQFKSELSKENL